MLTLTFIRSLDTTTNMTKQSLKKLPAAQAIQALRLGAGAETLPSSVRGVVLSYVANLEERGVK